MMRTCKVIQIFIVFILIPIFVYIYLCGSNYGLHVPFKKRGHQARFISDHLTKNPMEDSELGSMSSISNWIRTDRNKSPTYRSTFRNRSWITSSGYTDFMNMPQIRFSSMFKNPCWNGTAGNGPLLDKQIHCIPYFYIIGVMKSGTSDLFQRLQMHPEVVFPGFKEAQWFAHDRTKRRPVRGRHSGIVAAKYGAKDSRKLTFFIKMYSKATELILQNPSHLDNGSKIYTHITVDASPSNIYLNSRWWDLPGNENMTEPRVTNLHCIKQLNPAARIIVMIRDPVNRLYSDYLFRFRHGGRPSNGAFHVFVKRSIAEFKRCLTSRTLRGCIYNDSSWHSNRKFRLDLGLYAFYMDEVWSVFDKEQVLTILLDEYNDEMRKTLHRVIQFLGLRHLNLTEMDKIVSRTVHNNKSYIREKAGPMLDETRRLLRQFYQPYNEQMAKRMGDDRYLFPE